MYTMRFDLRVPGMTPAQIASQYETAIEMAEWAEGKGCAAVMVSEHHASPDGYLPDAAHHRDGDGGADQEPADRGRRGAAAALRPRSGWSRR